MDNGKSGGNSGVIPPSGHFIGRDDPRNGRGPAPGTGGRPPKVYKDSLLAMRPEALAVVADIMEQTKNPGLRLSAAKDVLLRSDPIKQELNVTGEVRQRVLVAYVNNWRKGPTDRAALPAPGADGDSVGGDEVQRPSVRETVGQDLDGGGPSARSQPAGLPGGPDSPNVPNAHRNMAGGRDGLPAGYKAVTGE